MLKSIARNTALSTVAFGITGLVGLLLMPIIINAFGLTIFGLITLSRSLLPTTVLSIGDLGASETTTQAVGRARGSGDWQRASEQISLLLVLTTLVGVTLAVVLWFGSGQLLTLFRVSEVDHHSFGAALRITALSLGLLFPALVVEGVAKGMERFDVLRSAEIISVLGYAAGCLLLIAAKFSYTALIYLYLSSLFVKYIFVLLFIWKDMRGKLRLLPWTPATRQDTLHRSALMVQSKVLGAVQLQLPTIAIGGLVGPAGVGTYEVVVRIPRFLKATLGLLATAVLPVAARLEGAGDQRHVARMAAVSFWFVPYATFPLLFGTAAMSPAILDVWIGREYMDLWIWLSAMLFAAGTSVCLTAAQSMLLIRKDYLRSINRLHLLGTAIQYAVSLIGVRWLGSMSFILGAALAALLTFPAHTRLLRRELELDAASVSRPLLNHVAFAASASLLMGLVLSMVQTHSTTMIVAAMSLWLVLYWSSGYLLLLGERERGLIHRFAFSLLPGARG